MLASIIAAQVALLAQTGCVDGTRVSCSSSAPGCIKAYKYCEGPGFGPCECVQYGPPVCTAGTVASCSASNCVYATKTCTSYGQWGSCTCRCVADSNPCTTDAWSGGQCLHTAITDSCCNAGVAKPAGSSCADANLCNGTETCNSSTQCVAGTPLATDDGNVCTADSCDPATGVRHDAITSGCCSSGTPVTNSCCTSGTAKVSGSSCADGDLCNGPETCNGSGQCLAGTPNATNDGNVCTADSCDPATGTVAHTAITAPCCSSGSPLNGGCCTFGVQKSAGAACSDGNACNGAETCDALAVCLAGTPLTVDDGNVCTLDVCDPATGSVTHPPVVAGTPCSSSGPCGCGATGACLANQSHGAFCYDARGNTTESYVFRAGDVCRACP
jgi:hypothetical protein